ncbi:MAG: hypothetical protein HC836_38250 [Richelia sp. RM2_1_2]|nr:hypothetical protein [Richelia sp. RM1_1_1]NJO63821.1 hypothetical protein [Richelia sp. RM2_1_2]
MLNILLDNLIASGIVTVAIAGIIFYLNPPIIKQSAISLLEPLQISNVLKEARQEASFYWYSGGTGKFTRVVTIPELAKLARAKNQTIELVIQILDPLDTNLCKLYADYRNGVRSADSKSVWTSKQVQIESYTTIATAYAYHSIQPLLKITVGLKQQSSLFRTDLSSVCAIITKEDPKEPALICQSGSLFYQSFLEDLRLSLKQATLLPQVDCPRFEELRAEKIAQLFKKLGILDQNLTEADLAQIVYKVLSCESSYATST